MTDLILDTHIFLWLMGGDPKLNRKNLERIETASNAGFRLCISAISIWEIGILGSKKRITFAQPVERWIRQAIQISSTKIIDLSMDILLDSCNLPEEFHGDPADRMIVATSRIMDIPLVTQDERIIAYINKGYCPN
jgi:PIN domain nuclease of toxin-antitoxin system